MNRVVEQYQDYLITGSLSLVPNLVIERGEGALLYDQNNQAYIDCFAGIAVANAGHTNQSINAAAKAQIDKVVHPGVYLHYSPVVGALAKELARICPGHLQKSFFGNSGAEAVEGAMRLAKRYTGKSEFIALEGSFHGRTHGALAVTGNSSKKRGLHTSLPGVAFAPAPYCYRCFAGSSPDTCGMLCARRVADIAKTHLSGDVAAMIAEPVMGEGGIIVPPPDYFHALKETLSDLGILFICDEVQTGFARTGAMFGIEHFEVEADIMTVAKGIANGFPLSAFISTPAVAEAFEPGDHYSTFGGNPVSCAAAMANVSFIEGTNLAVESLRKGLILKRRFLELMQTRPEIGDVRGLGLMLGIELVTDRATKQPAPSLAAAVKQYCVQKRVLIGVGGLYGNMLRVQPPLVITDDELDQVFMVIAEALSTLRKTVVD